MKRQLIILLVLPVLLLPALSGRGEGITLRTVSCFAGSDSSDTAYLEILKAYEEKTGNTVADRSASSDETWKRSVLNDFAAGNEPDILFFFAAGADSAPILKRVVSLEEIMNAYPSLRLPQEEALRENDGKIYAVPVRSYWEGLYIHTDLFLQYGAPLPVNWEALMEDIRIFRENGIIPIAVSLSDIPHYLAEMAILACASPEEQQARPQIAEEVPASWVRAMALIRELAEAGAFSDNALSTYERATTELFRTKKAAMQFDGSWLAASLQEEERYDLEVLPVPRRDGLGVSSSFVGGVSMGFYLTRRAWEKPERKEAAVELFEMLTCRDSLEKLGNTAITGRLRSSAEQMTGEREMLSPLQDAMNPEARAVWLLDCIPAVAEGRMSPEECWHRVMSLRPFEE